MSGLDNYQQIILDNIVDTAWFISADGILKAVNNAFLSFYNCKLEDVIGKTYFDVIDPESAKQYQAEDDEVIRTLSPKIIETALELTNSVHWIETILTPVIDDSNNCTGIVGISRNITDRKENEQKLHLADEVIDATTEAIMITDKENKLIRVNQAFTDLTGYEKKEVLGKDPNILRSDRSTSLLYKEMWADINEEGHWQGEIWDKRKDGSTYPKWLSISTIHEPETDEVINYMAIFTDVTERKKIENHIKYVAYHDQLTDLANQAAIEKKLMAAIEDAEAENESYYIALMKLDLDNFKKVNETLGHHIGDEALKTVAKIITSCLRSTDIVARCGGDEFTVMIDKVKSIYDVRRLGQTILEKFQDAIDVGHYSLHITPSIGFCFYPQDGLNHEILLQSVDTAMYRAKQNGKNQCAFFDQSMTDELLKHVKVENQIRKAIKQNLFKLHYQPQISLQDQRLVGVEALIRLNIKREFISPAEFIPVAEDTGLIIPIGEWVLKQACQDAMLWKQTNPDIKFNVAVNLSAHQFEYDYLLNLVSNVLSETGLPAECLTLEITETTVIADVEETIRLLSAIKAMGIKLAMDDFGTGYSSLSYLKSFDLDYIKIDRSFITDIPNDQNDCSITQAIINMAKGLDLKVIAEGAETQEQIEFLIENGCDKVQGFFYGKPMSSDDFNQFMIDWHKKVN